MRSSGPFFTVLIFHILGLWHAYLALEPGRLEGFDVWMLVYRLGLLGDFQINELTSSVPHTWYYYVFRIVFMIVGLLVTVTLMNVFIADLSNSFNRSTQSMETIFQRHRANTVLSHMAVQSGFERMKAALRRSTVGT